MTPNELATTFQKRFNRPPSGIVRAPGRVNLIGEHTDYNDGFVLPIAIDRVTLAAWAPRDDHTVTFTSLQQEADARVELSAPPQPGNPAWANYPKGVLAGLLARGIDVPGADVLFESDVPLGGGLSSSASLEVASALALLAAAGQTVPDRDLALLCQEAEHTFAGTPCGIMDQSIAIMGQSGHALLLDCRSGHTRQIPFNDPGKVILVVDTQVKHELSDGGYAARRDQCYAAAAKLGVKMLRDTDASAVVAAAGKLTDKEFHRARHVVGEIHRTLEAVAALESADYTRFGELMYASHASLRDDYDVSCEELDTVVDTAEKCDGVYGARMTGGGFGGCAIIVADADRVSAITETVSTAYEARFNHPCTLFATPAAAGAGTVH